MSPARARSAAKQSRVAAAEAGSDSAAAPPPNPPGEAGAQQVDHVDDALVAAARSGDASATDELLLKYRRYARAKARSYFIVGGDEDDLVQEGMIGLFKAVRDYDPEAQSSFRVFAELCITRQIISAIKAATRHKHGPLNSYVSLSRPVGGAGESDDGDRTLADVLMAAGRSDPADLVVCAEDVRALQAHLDAALSELETEVLRLHLDGKSYAEIADVLSRHVKSIDNALQRIKRKLDEHLRARSEAETD